jgi:hypothetical protein
MILIGITGPARAGKSTIARYLCEDNGFHEVSFAAPIKRMIANGFDLDIKDLESPEVKEATLPWLGRSPRYLLQTLGTDWARKMVNPDTWLILAARRIERAKAMGAPGVVVSDVRFNNEADFILARGGEIWRVWRQAATAVRAHESESGINHSYPVRGILNNAAFHDLYKRIDELLDVHGAGS